MIKKIYNALSKTGVELRGFYTEELREGGQRIGFDVVTLDGNRGPLARIQDSERFPFINSLFIFDFDTVLYELLLGFGEKCHLTLTSF